MTTASVKDMGIVMNAAVSSLGKAASAAENASFQNVWDSQTGQDDQGEAAVENRVEPSRTSHREEAMKARETVRKEVKETEQPAKDVQELSQDKAEEAMEELAVAAAQLVQEVADAFGITAEEVEALMGDMGISAMDLLQPEHLSALFLRISGAQDTFSLLTDENLYQDFTSLLERQGDLLERVAQKLQISPEQAGQLAEELAGVQGDGTEDVLTTLQPANEEPVIEISVEENTAAPEAVQAVDSSETEQKSQTQSQSDNSLARQQTQIKGEEHKQVRATNEESGNLVLQNLRNQSEVQATESTVQTASVWDADTENIMRQIMDYMRIQVSSDVSDLEMQLHPAHLGSLRIHVSSQSGVLTANFVTENEAVKAVLESQMIQLKESFEQQGVKVEAIEVTVQAHEFDRNLQQGRGGREADSRRGGRTRRVNLNADSGSEEIQEMTQEEALAAEMMAAQGSTVDYTA